MPIPGRVPPGPGIVCPWKSSYADLELRPVERIQHEIADDEAVVRKVEVVVDCRAARIGNRLTEDRSIKIGAARQGYRGGRSINYHGRLRVAGDLHRAGAGIIDLQIRRIQSRILRPVARQADGRRLVV